MNYTIYRATNTVTGMSYIGRTSRELKERMSEHLSTAFSTRCKNNFHISLRESNDFFEWSIEETGIESQSIANEREVFFTKKYNSIWPYGYNTMKAGNFTPIATEETREKLRKISTGRKMSQEAKDRIRDKNVSNPNTPIGKPMTEEARERLLKSHSGKPLKEETKKKLSEAMRNRVFTDEHRANLAEAGRRRVLSEEARNNMRIAQQKRHERERLSKWTKA